MMDYRTFLETKAQLGGEHGFAPRDLPAFLFPFQGALVEWSLRKGRAAIFADCGLGKTPMQLVWADQVARHTGKPVLILTPLAVAQQTVAEAGRFGIEAVRSERGEIPSLITVTNYERLHHFRPDDFSGLVCDESSILKNFSGARKADITEFMRRLPYRLLATATAAPNDYTELGTSSEALGELGYMDMLGRFFTNTQNTTHVMRGKYRLEGSEQFRFKGHAEEPFWRWVASWARAARRPSDLGFDDAGYVLPPITYREQVVEPRTVRTGALFDIAPSGFWEEQEERRRTIPERCEAAAALVADTGQPAVVWCHLNEEGDLLERLIPGAVQVAGRHSDDVKEERLAAFTRGEIRVLVTKPKLGAWGLNWQHCNHVVTFPSHSYEQLYQSVRRCWRFGQERPVTVDIVASRGEAGVRANLQRKADQADRMFEQLTLHMRQALAVDRRVAFGQEVRMPAWLQ